MTSVYAGALSILPPVLAIVLALLTKEVVSSLLIGILSGTIVYAVMAELNPVVAPIQIMFDMTIQTVDLYIILFCCLLGALVHVVSMAGGSIAYGNWASRKLKSKRSAMLATGLLGCLIFIDDYFNCLTVGTVMQPVTDHHRVSRAKLAYIIDSTAAPVCIIAPISSWAAAVGSNLRDTAAFPSDFAAFCATIPYNLYALLTIVTVIVVCSAHLDFGRIAQLEARAEQTGDLGVVNSSAQELPQGSRQGRVWDMLLPIGVLILCSILSMLYSGGFWGTDPAFYGNFSAALGNCNAGQALTWGGFAALLCAFVQFVPRGLIRFRDFMDGVTKGIAAMVPAIMILVLAWTISGVCRDLLQTDVFVKNIMAASNIPGAVLPALIFVAAAFLSFSTGTAWGTFGILIPIIIPVAATLSPNLVIVSLSATLGGSVFGDHCSPISDTTILSSTGAGCNHLEHVTTQLPYALLVGACCIVGYLVAGFTNGNLPLMLLTSLSCLLTTLFILHRQSVCSSL